MSKSAKSYLENINNVSRQLLSQLSSLEELQDNFQSELQQKDNLNTSHSKQSADSYIANKILSDLMSERHRLIVSLFENHLSEEISVELALINEMATLNTELMSKSKSYKQSMSEQVLKVKSSAKVTRFYQKY